MQETRTCACGGCKLQFQVNSTASRKRFFNRRHKENHKHYKRKLLSAGLGAAVYRVMPIARQPKESLRVNPNENGTGAGTVSHLSTEDTRLVLLSLMITIEHETKVVSQLKEDEEFRSHPKWIQERREQLVRFETLLTKLRRSA